MPKPWSVQVFGGGGGGAAGSVNGSGVGSGAGVGSGVGSTRACEGGALELVGCSEGSVAGVGAGAGVLVVVTVVVVVVPGSCKACRA